MAKLIVNLGSVSVATEGMSHGFDNDSTSSGGKSIYNVTKED